jgi:hypothetical protein
MTDLIKMLVIGNLIEEVIMKMLILGKGMVNGVEVEEGCRGWRE